MKPLTLDQLENIGSLITIKGTNQCLGDLMHFDGRGTYCAVHGLVPVTNEQADIHNKCLDEAKLKGMDDNCQIGQGSYAYYTKPLQVTTFIGTIVANGGSDVTVNGQSITFRRNGKTYRGRLSKEHDSFNFRRVA